MIHKQLVAKTRRFQCPPFIKWNDKSSSGLSLEVKVPKKRDSSTQPREPTMTDSRDIQHGVNDPVGGVDVKHRIKDNQTPHERAQWAADVRSEPSADPAEEFLPE